ncbi:MAG: pyridoxamine 5'-phosphate oxidase [Polyangiaceae bacterium]
MSPLATLAAWIDDARRAGDPEPDAMAFATASASGAPSVRVVYCRGLEEDGVRFFTNYESRKGRDIEANPVGAAVFHWPALKRQVRLEGRVEKVAAEVSDAYFHSRARGSQVASAISPQSRPVESLDALRAACDALESRLAGAEVPRPAHWGGYRLVPSSVELWTSGDHRLHDRIVYVRGPGGVWQGTRLGP